VQFDALDDLQRAATGQSVNRHPDGVGDEETDAGNTARRGHHGRTLPPDRALPGLLVVTPGTGDGNGEAGFAEGAGITSGGGWDRRA
jgi:hypothetical protein